MFKCIYETSFIALVGLQWRQSIPIFSGLRSTVEYLLGHVRHRTLYTVAKFCIPPRRGILSRVAVLLLFYLETLRTKMVALSFNLLIELLTLLRNYIRTDQFLGINGIGSIQRVK